MEDRPPGPKKVGILARVPLASGLLTGKMRRDTAFAADDHRHFNREGQLFDKYDELIRPHVHQQW